MKTQFKTNKLVSALSVRTGTTGDSVAIQKTVDNCNAKTAYLNTIQIDGVDTQIVSVETSKDSNVFAHIALDTFVLSAISKMYPRDAAIGGRIPLDGTLLNGVVDARASSIRSIMNGVEVKTAKIEAEKLDSAALFAHSLRMAKAERIADYTAFLDAQLQDVIDNPASYLANTVQAGKPVTLGKINVVGIKAEDLPSFLKPFDLPMERVKALLLAEQHSHALATMLESLAEYKPINGRVVKDSLCVDCTGLTSEQQADLRGKGYTVTAKDTSELANAINTAIAKADFETVKDLTMQIIDEKDCFVISKAI